MTENTYKPGDHHYRAYVGPFGQYDVMGLTQAALLYACGLRENHKLLDLGCGSLRAGRLLIPYLQRGGYYGIEPNEWLVEEGIRENVGQDMIFMRQPRFSYNADFDCSVFGEKFDFIIAQSIMSHTKRELARRCIQAMGNVVKEDGLILSTFFIPGETFKGELDSLGDEWVYPGLVAFREPTVLELFREEGLSVWPLHWFHPKQRWFAASPRSDKLTDFDVQHLTGYVVNAQQLRR